MAKSVSMVVVVDRENAESRSALSQILSANENIRSIPIQLVKDLLPGLRATPAFGVVMWLDNLQGAEVGISTLAEKLAAVSAEMTEGTQND